MSGQQPADTTDAQTLAEVVAARALRDDAGPRIAYTFLPEGHGEGRSITWVQLDRRARQVGAALLNSGASGAPVMLALGSGLEFIESLLGCWYAGAIAVPVSLPRHQRVKHRLDRIVHDAGAGFVIGYAETRQRLSAAPGADSIWDAMTWIDPANVGNDAEAIQDLPRNAGRTPAVLQYTSGSTGSPRGVLVTHANLMHNSSITAQACGHGPGDIIGGWLPLFHDMGLVGLVIQAAFTGARSVLMPPERFLMRPWLWLQMISHYRIGSSPAPNFAYDLCVDRITAEQKATLDLGCWRNALNGSEPVRASTLDRFASAFAGCGFRSDAFFPCYGLAEATLLVTAPTEPRRRVCRNASGALLPAGVAGHVGCGRTFGDTRLAIVDPDSRRRVAPGTVGEIWLAGESCASGYWNDATKSLETFHARLVDETAENEPLARDWLRTGDLGFVADGELFITGRLRELIIIAGRNHFPADIERTVEGADSSIALSGTAAFSIDVDGLERLVVAAEVRRELARPAANQAAVDVDAVRGRIRAAIAAEHEVAPHEVVLLRPGAVARTTSGKISRAATRQAYLQGTLERFEELCHVHNGRT